MNLVSPIGHLYRHLGLQGALRAVKEAGFDGYDFPIGCIVPDKAENLRESEYYYGLAREARAYADSIGLPCLQSHSVSPWCRAPENMESAVKIETISLEVSAILGSPICVVHPAFHLDAEENKKEFYSPLMPIAHKHGFRIATENMFIGGKTPEGVYQTFPGRCGTCEDFVRFIDVANDPAFTACLDIGHAEMINCEGAPALIRALGHDRLGCLHVQDNDCIHDNHMFPYQGKIDWEEICRALGEIDYQGCFTYEADAGYMNLPPELLPAALEMLAKVGRHLISRIDYYRTNH